MMKEFDRFESAQQTKVFDLLIHGICRGWLPCSATSVDREEFPPPADYTWRMHRFAAGAVVPAVIAILATAVISFAIIELSAVNVAGSHSAPEPASHVADAGEPVQRMP
jgi:hypothetical protein